MACTRAGDQTPMETAPLEDPHEPPRERVQLDYVVEVYGATKTVAPPCVVTLVTDLGASTREDGGPSLLVDRKFLHFDRDALDGRVSAHRPTIRVGSAAGVEGQVIDFGSIADFSPLALAARSEPMKLLLQRRTALSELHSRLLTRGDLVAPLRSALQQGIEAPVELLEQLDEFAEHALEQWAVVVEEVRSGALDVAADFLAALHARVDVHDEDLGRRVTQVLRDGEFLRLESAWLGVQHLLPDGSDDRRCTLRVLSATRKELYRDLHSSAGHIEQLLCGEFDLLGGEPAGLLVLDFEFSQDARDVSVLGAAARLAAKLNLHVVAAAAPAMLGVDNHAAATQRYRLRELQRLPEYAGWHQLRADPTATHLSLVAPRAVARAPHAMAGGGAGEFRYVEPPASANSAPWISGAVVLAGAILDVVARDGWPAALDCRARPFLLPATPVRTGVDTLGALRVETPLEAEFCARTAADLAALGIIALRRRPGSTQVMVDSACTASAAPRSTPREHTELGVSMALQQLARWLRCQRRDQPWQFSRHGRAVWEASLARITTSDDAAEEAATGDAPPRAAGTAPARVGPAVLAAAEVVDWVADHSVVPPMFRLSVLVQPTYGFSLGIAPALLALSFPIAPGEDAS